MDTLNDLNTVIANFPDWKKGYIAGIIDGEGFISITIDNHRFGHWTPHVGFCNTCLQMMNIVVSELHFGSFKVEKPGEGHLGKKALYRWEARSILDCYLLLTAVRDYMIVKRVQAGLVIRFCELKMTDTGNEFLYQGLYEEIKCLNGQ